MFLLVLNGKGIDEGVRRLEYGAHRSFLLKVTEPLRIVSEVTRVSKFRDAVEVLAERWLGN